MTRVKSYPVNLVPDLELPKGLFDPRWNDPRIAAKVAFEVYKRLRYQSAPFDGGELAPPSTFPRFPKSKSETRVFTLGTPLSLPGMGGRVRGGAYNELHRRFTFGGGQPAVNFHAQAIAFGFDEAGRYFLRATVGRYDGNWGNYAALMFALRAGGEDLCGAVWSRAMDPSGDVDALITGQDERIPEVFEKIGEISVTFFAEHLGERAAAVERAETEEDRVLDNALEVFGSKE